MSQPRPEHAQPIDSERLFRRYAQFVASFLRRLGTRSAELEDLVQDVFMTAHCKGGYRPGAASPTTFLARLAFDARRSTQRRAQRSQSNQREAAQAVVASAEAATPEHNAALRQEAEQLQAVLDAMEPQARAVFMLFELEGESCDAIAAGLGLKLGTVYSRLHSARAEFRSRLARAESNACRAPLQGVRKRA